MLNPRLRLKPIPLTCMLATTAMPATPMVPTAATAQLSLPATNTFPLPLPLMASTNSTNVRLRLPPRLMPMPLLPTMVDITATPDTTDTVTDTVDTTVDITDILIPDTELTVILASVPLMLNPPSLTLTVAHKVPMDSTDSPIPVMPPLPTMAFPTTVKLNEQLLLARTSDYDDLKSFGFVTTR